MKRTDISELRKKPELELRKLLAEKQERLRVLRMDLAMGKSAQIKDIRDLKQTVARIQTFLNPRHAGNR